jgi:hypothetical protein
MHRMTVQVHDRRQDAYHKPAGVALDALLFPKCHQLAFDMPGQRPGELDGVALATTEEAFGAERRRGDVEDPNVASLLAASMTLAACCCYRVRRWKRTGNISSRA